MVHLSSAYGIVLLSIQLVQAVEIYFQPLDHEIQENDEFKVDGYLQFNESDREWRDNSINLAATSAYDLVRITNSSQFIFVDETTFTANFTFLLNVVEFGHEVFLLEASLPNNSNVTSNGRLPLRLLRRESALDVMFLAILGILIIINNVNMGSILDTDEVKAVFKRPIGPIVGFGSQFLFMPLASFGVATLLLDNASMRFGLFALGSSPGGTGSNFWTFLLGGDLQLSVVMTVISTLAALGMMPLWLLTLGQRILEESNVKIPFGQLFIPLGSFILPVIIGIGIRKRCPRMAAMMKKIFPPFTVFLLVFIITVGMYTNMYLFRFMTWQIILAGLLVSWGGFIFGALAASAFCMKREQIVAISIETAMQNAGIAFMMLKMSLPQPDADLAAVAPVAQLLVTGPILWGSLLIYKLHNCFRKPKEDAVDGAESTSYSIGQKLRLWAKRKESKQSLNENVNGAKQQEILLNART